jgi:hypothetical protein
MGAAAADFDGDGLLDIFRTNFSDERSTLYRNRGEGDFDEATTTAGMAHNTRYVGWGAGFLDFDNDGWPDLLLVNGHVFPEVESLDTDIRYRDQAILYRNQGDGTFADLSDKAGPGILERHAARGAAFGDYDNDGQIDVLVNNQNEPPTLLKQTGKGQTGKGGQTGGGGGNWILLKLEGAPSNRSAIGAKVELTAGGRTQVQEVRSGGSYLSQGDLRLHFGIGPADHAGPITIIWPSGERQSIETLAANQIHTLRESGK